MNKKLHILHVPKWYPHPEDPQLGVFIQKQIQAASPYDHHYVLFVKSVKKLEGTYQIEVLKKGNVHELYIYYQKPESRSEQFFLIRKLYKMGFEKIAEEFAKPDILHVHNLISPAVWTYKYAKENNIPWVLSEHWSGYTAQAGIFASKMIWERKLWQWYSEKACCTIAVSSFLQAALKKNAIGNIHHIIPNVVEGSLVESQKTSKEINIFNVSDMVDEIKNISGLIHAFKKLLPAYPLLKLHLLGGGKDLKKLKSLAKQLELNDKITFYGRLKNEEVLKLYHKADFVVINSRVETFSVVAAEALMAGKPVLTTRCGGVEEFVTKELGILVKNDDQKSLEKGLEEMILNYQNYDPKLLSDYAKNKFSTEAIGLSLSRIYHSIIT